MERLMDRKVAFIRPCSRPAGQARDICAQGQKRHKIAVVNDLKDRGFFMLKESVEMAAQALQVTRFTIYNYLNELGNEERDR